MRNQLLTSATTASPSCRSMRDREMNAWRALAEAWETTPSSWVIPEGLLSHYDVRLAH